MYYVYLYLNPLKDYNLKLNNLEIKKEPFYVGKGQGDRYLHHLNKVRNNCKYKDSNKFQTIKYILESNQVPIIEKIICSSELESLNLEKKLIKMIGRLDIKTGPLTNKNDGGIKPQDNYRHTDETKRKITESLKNRIPQDRYDLISPSGNLYQNVNLLEFCKMNNLNYHKMRKWSNTGKIKVALTKNVKIQTVNCEGWEVINKKKNKNKIKVLKYILISPLGEEFKIFNGSSLKHFAETLGLDMRILNIYRNKGVIKIRNINQCKKYESVNCEGWQFIDPNRATNDKYFESTRKNKWKVISPNGEITLIPNLKEFCDKNNLSERTFRSFINRGEININLKKFNKQKFKNSIGWQCFYL
jgi:hypothetical protein